MNKNIIASFVLAMVGFLSFVLVLPQYNAVKAAKEAVQLRQATLSERAALLENVRKLDSDVKSRQADIEKIKTFVPEGKRLDELVSSIEKIADQSGLQLLGLSTSEVLAAVGEGHKRVLVNMDASGSYSAFINFLKLLEQSLRIYDVFDITAALSTTVIGNVNFSLKTYAYYLDK